MASIYNSIDIKFISYIFDISDREAQKMIKNLVCDLKNKVKLNKLIIRNFCTFNLSQTNNEPIDLLLSNNYKKIMNGLNNNKCIRCQHKRFNEKKSRRLVYHDLNFKNFNSKSFLEYIIGFITYKLLVVGEFNLSGFGNFELENYNEFYLARKLKTIKPILPLIKFKLDQTFFNSIENEGGENGCN